MAKLNAYQKYIALHGNTAGDTGNAIQQTSPVKKSKRQKPVPTQEIAMQEMNDITPAMSEIENTETATGSTPEESAPVSIFNKKR